MFLVGASGSGKSTFLRLVLKEEKATRGTVHVAGKDVAQLSSWKVPHLRRTIGVVFQDFRLLPNKTVFENVAFALQVIGKPRHAIAHTVPEVLDLVGLAGQGAALPARAVRRRAAARRDRARVRQPARDPAGRRADRATSTRRPASASCACSTGSTAPARRSSWPRTTTRSSTRCASASSSSTTARMVRDQDRGVYGYTR